MAIETNLIRQIEARSLNAWAAPQSMLIDGWIARFAYGYTKRANSVSVLYEGDRPIAEKIEICQQIYTQQNLPLIFRLSPLAPIELNDKLAELGFEQFDLTSVKIKDLSQFEQVAIEHLQIDSDYSKWLKCFAQVCQVSIADQQQLAKILASIIPAKAFAVLWKENEPIAVGLAVLEDKDVGLFEIETRESYRRQGYGRSLILGLLSWAKQQGATTAYLQVVADNQPALKLYEKLGFTELYQYFYRVQNYASTLEKSI